MHTGRHAAFKQGWMGNAYLFRQQLCFCKNGSKRKLIGIKKKATLSPSLLNSKLLEQLMSLRKQVSF